MAMIVNDFLVNQFATILDYSFTANVEEELDAIAEGKINWQKMISNFYEKFHPSVESSKSISRSDIGSVRELGVDPATGKKVYAKIGKFGPYIQIGENGPDEKPAYSSLRNGQLLETITLEEALELFKLPRTLGTFEDQEVQVNIGKFGPYVRHGNKFCSLEQDDDPMTITLEKAIELIKAKRAEDASRVIKTFEENPEYQILKGKWGPYLKAGRKNIKLPKGKKAEDLTYEECVELVKNAPVRKKTGKRRKK
jgi:DNA topoisomerase-1